MNFKTQLDFTKIDDVELDIDTTYNGSIEIEVLKMRPRHWNTRVVVIHHSINNIHTYFTALVSENGTLRLPYGNEEYLFRSIFKHSDIKLCMLSKPDFAYYAYVTYANKNQIKNTPIKYFASKEKADTFVDETVSGMIKNGTTVIAKHSELVTNL